MYAHTCRHVVLEGVANHLPNLILPPTYIVRNSEKTQTRSTLQSELIPCTYSIFVYFCARDMAGVIGSSLVEPCAAR